MMWFKILLLTQIVQWRHVVTGATCKRNLPGSNLAVSMIVCVHVAQSISLEPAWNITITCMQVFTMGKACAGHESRSGISKESLFHACMETSLQAYILGHVAVGAWPPTALHFGQIARTRGRMGFPGSLRPGCGRDHYAFCEMHEELAKPQNERSAVLAVHIVVGIGFSPDLRDKRHANNRNCWRNNTVNPCRTRRTRPIFRFVSSRSPFSPCAACTGQATSVLNM